MEFHDILLGAPFTVEPELNLSFKLATLGL
jgi:hypothetical protein